VAVDELCIFGSGNLLELELGPVTMDALRDEQGVPWYTWRPSNFPRLVLAIVRSVGMMGSTFFECFKRAELVLAGAAGTRGIEFRPLTPMK
jgi:hypothetical protein